MSSSSGRKASPSSSASARRRSPRRPVPITRQPRREARAAASPKPAVAPVISIVLVIGPPFQLAPRRDERSGLSPIAGDREQVRLMASRNRSGGKQHRIAGARAKLICPDSGQVKEPLGPPFVGIERCGKRRKRRAFGSVGVGTASPRLRTPRWRGSQFGQDPDRRGQCAEHQAVLRPSRRAWPRAAAVTDSRDALDRRGSSGPIWSSPTSSCRMSAGWS
jgi:hypothetical protein